MNPYREAAQVASLKRRGPAFPWHKAICYSIALVTAAPVLALHWTNPVEAIVDFTRLPLLVIGFIAWMIGVQAPAASDARARMCRILWNCGQRDTAVGVSIGWIPLRVSEKRMDRNARAVARFVQQRRRERYPWMKE